jgi:small GTP-binding protein
MLDPIKCDHDYLYKIIIVGDSGTGKSSLLARYVDNEFDSNYISTIGVDFKIKNVEKNGKNIRLQLWDTAGQERFRAIAKSYYRGAHFCIITFDLANPNSFDNISIWVSEIKNNSNQHTKYIIVGTKVDLIDENYDRQYIFNYCGQINAKYIESSSKNDQNIDYIFDHIINELGNDNTINIQRKRIKPITKEIIKDDKKCCS